MTAAVPAGQTFCELSFFPALMEKSYEKSNPGRNETRELRLCLDALIVAVLSGD
ncbi:hypothetical protein J6590_072454 [Homalodisca vitripennis]|nr:hypothetical protein J6590_072454 [Homalodisca vitripennis]